MSNAFEVYEELATKYQDEEYNRSFVTDDNDFDVKVFK